MSAEEQRAEQLCEEERYLFLYNNEEELRLRQGEHHGGLVVPPDPKNRAGVSIYFTWFRNSSNIFFECKDEEKRFLEHRENVGFNTLG